MRYQLLRDSDAMGMAHGLEIRVPFLDNRFSSLAWSLGAGVRDGKQTFARVCRELLPAAIMTRPKQGFTFPFAAWMAGPLAEDMEDKLDALPPDLFANNSVTRLWKAFINNPDRVGWTRPWSLYALSTYLTEHKLTP